ncbi:polymorphic toxin type 15 domain-containing protein [Georgenia sp. Z1491]|uniref:polymorphic toxin type 15 domain-containing protein n=1 Tax=Georgenia sp. Z1491 TaxID=3416707 RepID=UPI003CF8BE2D
MSAPNPLVAPVEDSSTALQGTFMLEGLEGVVTGMQNEDWVAASVSGLTAVLDFTMFVDPFGAIISMGVGWLMEHFQPLKGWLDDLTGDADAVTAFATTWTNVQDQLIESQSALQGHLDGQMGWMSAGAITTYRGVQQRNIDALGSCAEGAGSAALALQGAAMIVQAVHDIVRDAIAEIVGAIVSAGLKALVPPLIPEAIRGLVMKVSSAAARLQRKIDGVIQSVSALRGLLDRLDRIMKRLPRILTNPGSVIPARPGWDELTPGMPRPRPPGEAGDPVPASHNTPGSNTPGSNTPGSNTPGANTPGSNTPGSNTPGSNTPGSNTPGSNTPGSNTPGSNSPGSNTPGSNSPGADTPGSNSPGSNTPGSNTPGSNSPGSNTPGSNSPGADTPGSNSPGPNTPGSNTPGSNSPGSNTPGSNSPGVDSPGSSTPGSSAPAPNQSSSPSGPSDAAPASSGGAGPAAPAARPGAVNVDSAAPTLPDARPAAPAAAAPDASGSAAPSPAPRAAPQPDGPVVANNPSSSSGGGSGQPSGSGPASGSSAGPRPASSAAPGSSTAPSSPGTSGGPGSSNNAPSSPGTSPGGRTPAAAAPNAPASPSSPSSPSTPGSSNGPGSSSTPGVRPDSQSPDTPGARPDSETPAARPESEGADTPSGRNDAGEPETPAARPESEGADTPSGRNDAGEPETPAARPESEGADTPTPRPDSEPEGPGNQWDPDESPRDTVPQSHDDAPGSYSDQDVADALDNAPRNQDGQPVDHRTGEPLRPDGPDGRNTHMKWDPDNDEWVLENPGGGARPDAPESDAPDAPDAPDTPDVDDPLPTSGDRWGDDVADPRHPHHDARPDDNGYVGTVDPDVESPSGLTDSGRLQDPDVVPPELQPFVDDGSIINDDGVLRFGEQVDIEFTHSNVDHSGAEFDRQVELQQQSLAQQSGQDWDDHTTGYSDRGRTGEADQASYRENQVQQRADVLEEQGLSPEQARAQADREMSDQAVLHGPDQVAGGNPNNFTGMGDAGVNSSLGSQWGGESGRAADLRAQMDAIIERSGIPDELLGDVRLNPRFTVDHTVDVP